MDNAEIKTRMKNVTLTKGFVSIEAPVDITRDKLDVFMDMIGGQRSLDLAYNQNKRIDLKFRPEDPICKPIRLDNAKTNDLLVRVVRKRKKVNPGEVRPPDSYIVEVLGVVGVTYYLKSMCDFQFLPVHKEPDGSYVDLIPKLDIRLAEDPEFSKKPMPMCVPPVHFSRIEIPIEVQTRHTRSNDNKFISRTRARRSNNTIFRGFSDPVPTHPVLSAARKLMVKVITEDQLTMVKKKFEEKPMWSKAELSYTLPGFHKEKLKYILPVVAYYFHTGPFRTLWVRLGFDPLKDPSTRFQQIVDYRLRVSLMIGTSKKFSMKRTSDVKAIHARRESRRRPATAKDVSEDQFILKPGFIPPARQMFYQIQNIQIPELQEKVKAIPPTKECTEKNGWFPSGVEDMIREMVVQEIKKSVQEKKGGAEPGVSDNESASDLEEDEEAEISEEEDEFSDSSEEDPDLEEEMDVDV